MKTTIQCERFEDFTAFLNTCDSRAYNDWAHYHRTEDNDWQGNSYTDARSLLLHGDAAAVEALRPSKLTQAASIRPKTVADVCGYAPIVPAAIEGLPTSMRRKKRAPVRSKVITLLCDTDYHCGIEVDEVRERGRELCAFIRGAELAGYRIALDIFCTFQRRDSAKGYAVRLNVKQASQPLDIKRVAYPLTHASMLRQLFFDWYERLPDAQELDGYGKPLNCEGRDRREAIMKQILKRGDVYVELMDGNFSKVIEGK